MAAPVLMTLFTDDAVEVRYSDQSCLQLSPCGSTFVHHESPGELVHQAHGMKTVSQRCQFVTSNYREKVLQALDFRNRFAERPFVCQSLIEEDQIMYLYARIASTAWPKSLEQSNFEYIQDGGVKLVSEDEYASLVLSPHKQDFTVCYLCGVSRDSQRKKISNLKHKKSDKVSNRCMKISDNVKKQNLIGDHENVLTFKNGPLNVSSERLDNQREDLNISPISLASTQMSRESSPINDSKTEIKRYSTPTNIAQHQKTQPAQKTQTNSLDGSFLQFVSKNPQGEPKNADNTFCSNSSNESKHSNDSVRSASQKHVHWTSKHSDESDISETGSVDSQTNSHILYSWITRHFSCDECPASWKHVLNMARVAMDNREELEKYSSASSVHISQKPRGILKKIKPENFSMTPLPESLPLTCPGQYLHKQYGKYVYDNSRDIVENITALSKGKLKIILIDGIVFRIVRLAATKFVEIYPGDGSVIMSEGLAGHFYRHLLPHDFPVTITERMYSLKALPPTPKTAPYSIEKLIKRASRFLLQTNQEDKTLADRLSSCCWKYKDSTLVEPLAATLLEECTVPGHGRFSAYSNGHVRILFDDRTSLDMACDFTERLMGCMEHSIDAKEKAVLQQQLEQQSHMECRSKQGLCKLLLPNGQYQIVDSKQPGIYKKYTEAALEWASWVNSSPNQRKVFYQHWNKEDDATLMVAKELQKIKCFNYLSETALSSTRDTDFYQDSLKQDYQVSKRPHGPHHPPQVVENPGPFHPSSNSGSVNSLHSFPNQSSYSTDRSFLPQHGVNNPSKDLEMMRGFNSVREALLRTSNAIKDIDEIIEKKNLKS